MNDAPPAQRAKPPIWIVWAAFGVAAVGVVIAWQWHVRVEYRRRVTELQFKLLALEYHNFYSQHSRAPKSLEELESNVITIPGFPETFKSSSFSIASAQIREGRFVMVWNAVLRNAEEGEKYYLGHATNVAQKGGLVMLANGAVRQMSPEEFAGLRKIPTREPDAKE